MNLYRWDLDRTYLDTDLGSMRGLMRAAIEPAAHKRNIPGAAALLRALVHHDPSAEVAVLSGSPEQMRGVLSEKLAMDGIRVDRLVLKDSLRSLRRGRLRAVRDQVGYKLPVLLHERADLGGDRREMLFGDDSETDALIYVAYAEAIAGRLSSADLARLLRETGAYSDGIDLACAALARIAKGDIIDAAFIRLDKATPVERFRLLGALVVPVFSWMQAALVLWHRQRLSTRGAASCIAACADEASLSQAAVAGLLQDAARRELVPAGAVMGLLRSAPELDSLASETERALARLGPSRAGRVAESPDFYAFLRSSAE